MHLLLEAARLPRRGTNVCAGFYLLKSIDFKLFEFEFPGSERQFYLCNPATDFGVMLRVALGLNF